MDFSSQADVKTSTLPGLLAKTVDTIVNYSPIAMLLLGNQKPWKGSKIEKPIKYAQNSNGQSFNGLEKFSLQKSNNFEKMKFDPTGREIPIVISGMERDVNESNKVIDLVARQIESDIHDMCSDIAGLFYTLQTGKNFLSLWDAFDDGTLGATSYGSLARATYTGLAGNYTAVGGALALSNLAAGFSAAQHGNMGANIMVTTKDIFDDYEALLTPTVSHNVAANVSVPYSQFVGAGPNGLPSLTAPGQALAGAQGFNALTFRGRPMVADEECTSGYLAGFNTRELNFYGLKSTDPNYVPVKFKNDGKIDGVYSNMIPKTNGFAVSKLMNPIDQYAQVAHIILMGNLICDNPRNTFLLTGIS